MTIRAQVATKAVSPEFNSGTASCACATAGSNTAAMAKEKAGQADFRFMACPIISEMSPP